MLTIVQTGAHGQPDAVDVPSVSLLDEIVRNGARQMLAAALQAEAAACVEAHADQLDGVVIGW